MTRFWFAAPTEEFPPSQMLEQAKAADRAARRRLHRDREAAASE
jgi:hypothetical protein